MKKLLTTIILLLTIGFIFTNYKSLMKMVMQNVVDKDYNITRENNEYFRNESWNYVQLTNNFNPSNIQDIMNIFYTALNSGWDEVTYYCADEYISCIKDTENITNDNYILSNINNFVSTYNSYNRIFVNYNSIGRVNITFERIYNKQQIEAINRKIDLIIKDIINDNMSDEEKIKAIHDYIINNTKYDEERANIVKSGTYDTLLHSSNTAYGALFNGKAICGGYTDTMALFLDKLGFKNYKISTNSHIWNVVYINGTWKHLDLTWDDPVTNTGKDILEYNFFLISDEELENKNTSQHNYDKSIYKN